MSSVHYLSLIHNHSRCGCHSWIDRIWHCHHQISSFIDRQDLDPLITGALIVAPLTPITATTSCTHPTLDSGGRSAPCQIRWTEPATELLLPNLRPPALPGAAEVVRR
jgi:hypothetical protein